MIKAGVLDIMEPVKMSLDVDVHVSGTLHIEPYAVIGKGFTATCRNLWIGRHCWIGDNVAIKYGAPDNPFADVTIGDYTGLMDGVLLNPSRAITIGKNCGLGVETQVWTHSGWLPIMQGFPMQKEAPVTIGDNVWLPSRCQVLPGVCIGDNVVVGIGSVVNRDLPRGCFAAGHPAQIIRAGVYPKELEGQQLRAELARIILIYEDVARDKGFKPTLTFGNSHIEFNYREETVLFNFKTMQFTPETLSDYAEDFRDYLRRYGLKFFGGGFFKSLPVGYR